MRRRARRLLGWGLLGVSLAGGVGCTCHLTAPPPVSLDLAEACSCVSIKGRRHVHLFFVQGPDPIDVGGLKTMKEQMQALGFPQAWYAPSFCLTTLKKEIAALNDGCDKRIVIVGYGLGVKSAWDLASAAGIDGIHVDLFVCIGQDAPRPENVSRKLTILTAAGCEPAEEEHSAEAVRRIDASLLSLPAHPETLELLGTELLGLAGSIPAVEDLPQPFHHEGEPTPRPPVMPPATASRDEWDFLRPASVEKYSLRPPGTLPGEKKDLPQPPRKQSDKLTSK